MMCRPEPFIGKGQLDKLGQSMLRGLCLSFNFFIIDAPELPEFPMSLIHFL